VSLDSRFCLLAGELLWLSVPFLVLAMAFRVWRWLRVPPSAVQLGMFGRKEPRWVQVGKDSFLFPQVLDLDRPMWGIVIAFHLAGVILFVGHLRLLFEFTAFAEGLGDRGLDRFAFVTGGTVGIVLLLGALYFLVRRLRLPGRSISTAADYVLLGIVLLVVLSGTQMRLFGQVAVPTYREFVHGIVSFDPLLPAALDTAVARWSLGAHLLFVNALFFYFPFSKLVHVIGSLVMNLIRSAHPRSVRS